LVEVAIALVRGEMMRDVQERAQKQVEERLLDAMLPGSGGGGDMSGGGEDPAARRQATREKLRAQLGAGQIEDQTIEISFEEKPNVMNMLGSAALELDPQMQGMFERMMPARREMRRMRVGDARRVLLGQEAELLLDRAAVTSAAIERAEEAGIIFLDEIDKIAGPEKAGAGPDVSRSGVQRDLLPLVEGSTVMTKYGPVRSDHVLFIAAGAFHSSEPGDLIPELQGRFPIRVELADLTKDDLVRILKEPKNALLRQQVELLATEGVTIDFTDDAIESLAYAAFDVNRRGQNIGARRLHTILERVLEPISFDASEAAGKRVTIDGAFVRARLKGRKGDEWNLL
jgi:ATP-dependent HslUV protease ATP-binding subunit HslU